MDHQPPSEKRGSFRFHALDERVGVRITRGGESLTIYAEDYVTIQAQLRRALNRSEARVYEPFYVPLLRAAAELYDVAPRFILDSRSQKARHIQGMIHVYLLDTVEMPLVAISRHVAPGSQHKSTTARFANAARARMQKDPDAQAEYETLLQAAAQYASENG